MSAQSGIHLPDNLMHLVLKNPILHINGINKKKQTSSGYRGGSCQLGMISSILYRERSGA